MGSGAAIRWKTDTEILRDDTDGLAARPVHHFDRKYSCSTQFKTPNEKKARPDVMATTRGVPSSEYMIGPFHRSHIRKMLEPEQNVFL